MLKEVIEKDTYKEVLTLLQKLTVWELLIIRNTYIDGLITIKNKERG